MFLRDPNVLFWLPGVNHRHASLPGGSVTAAAWAAFLHPAAGRGGTKQEQICLGGIFFLLHACICVITRYLTPAGLWGPNSQVLTQPTQTYEQTSSSRSFIAPIRVQKEPPTEYKAVTLQNARHNLTKEELHETLPFCGMAVMRKPPAFSISAGLEIK